MTMRDAACAAIVDVFREDERAALVLADISLDRLAPAFEHDPARVVNVGIMEQTAVGVAAGFALEGYRPIVHTLAPFLVERPFEQLKLGFGYHGQEGLFVSAGASYDYSEYGLTHHSPGDIAALATIPGMDAIVPGTAREAAAAIRRAHANGRATYVRTALAENRDDRELAPGGLTKVRTGSELTAIAVGPMLDRTLEALAGIDATVLYATTVLPLDAATLSAESAPAPEVLVVEPFAAGTLAAQVTAALSHRPIRLASQGVPRRVFSRYGTIADHDRAHGLDAAGIRERTRSLLAG